MNPSLAIGIDLGTTYSCVAVRRQNDIKPEVILNDFGRNTTPSVVLYDEDGDICAGQTAKNLAYQNPDSTVFDIKRLIGRSFFDQNVQKYMNLLPFSLINLDGMVGIKVGEITLLPQLIAKELISHLRQIAQTYLRCPITTAVVTIPAYFNEIQKGLTRQACHEAGLTTVHFITEPTAAAYAYGLQSSIQPGETKTCLIFDLGGGTFDITVFKLGSEKNLEILATGGDARLGGEDFNDLLTDYCIGEFKRTHSIDLVAGKHSENTAIRLKTAKILLRIRTECENKKIDLSYVKKVVVSLDGIHNDIDFAIRITRKVFEDLIDKHLKRCIGIMDKILKKHRIEKEAIDNVVLIGGSSRIPKVQQMVTDFFGGKELHKNINPDEAVAYGAAVCANDVFCKEAADSVITVIDTTSTSPLDSYASVESIFPIQTAALLNSNPQPKPRLNRNNNELLYKDLQSASNVIMKHKHIFLPKALEVRLWFQHFEAFKEDFKNCEKASSSFGSDIVLSAMLDTLLLPELANILWERYEHEDALKLNEIIMKRRTTKLGPDHLETIEAQFQIAKCLDDINYDNSTLDATNALDLFERVYNKRYNILGENHQHTMAVEYHFARFLIHQKKYSDALALADKVLRVQNTVLGPDDIDTLRIEAVKVVCLSRMKKHTQAIELALKLYAKISPLLSEPGRAVLIAKSRLAIVLRNGKQYEEALCLYKNVYKAQVSILGKDNLKTLKTRQSIGICYSGLKKHSKALEVFQSVHGVRKKILGPNHRETLSVENDMAYVIYDQDNRSKAIDLLKQIHERETLHLGKDDPLTLLTLGNFETASKVGSKLKLRRNYSFIDGKAYC